MENISLVSSFVKMIFALAIVLGVLIAAMYFFKKFMQNTTPAADNKAVINIIASKYLSPKNSIILVEVLDQIIVVGISGQQMTTLACIDDPESVEKMRNKLPVAASLESLGDKIKRYKSLLNISSGKGRDNKR